MLALCLRGLLVYACAIVLVCGVVLFVCAVNANMKTVYIRKLILINLIHERNSSNFFGV